MSAQPLPAAALLATGLVLLAVPANALFVNNANDIPQNGIFNGSNSENIDFGDVDLDGDWGVVFADGPSAAGKIECPPSGGR